MILSLINPTDLPATAKSPQSSWFFQCVPSVILEARIELGTQILGQRRVFIGVVRNSCVDVPVSRVAVVKLLV